ncbi:DUF721 domain-containing protein [Prevotella fusca]
MFRRKVQPLDDVLNQFLRQGGLESPLLQKRVVDAWDTVAGSAVAHYTQEKFIRNQTLFIKITNPALRADLSMMQSELVQKLNAAVGSMVITEVRLY